MIINSDILREFERSEIARKDISYKDALAIFEALRKEAVSLGVFSCENILDGLDVDIRIAKAVNGLR
jgi:hypothetical protein